MGHDELNLYLKRWVIFLKIPLSKNKISMYQSNKTKFMVLILVAGITLFIASFLLIYKLEIVPNRGPLIALSEGELDADKDGLSDDEERELGTNLYNADTDNDGYTDLIEVQTYHDPNVNENEDLLDKDNDGLIGKDERQFNTDPDNPDSDGDGYPDGMEVASGFSPKMMDLGLTSQLLNNTKALNSLKEAADSSNLEDFNSKFSITLKQLGASDAEIFLPEISDSQIKITDQTGKQAVEDYINSMAVILQKNIPFQDSYGFQQFALGFDYKDSQQIQEMIDLVNKTISEIEKVEVPKEAVPIHKQGLSLVEAGLSVAKKLKTMNKYDLFTMLSLVNQSQFLFNTAKNGLSQDIINLANTYNIEPSPLINSIFVSFSSP